VGLRLLDLHHHLAAEEDRFGAVDDLGAGGTVLVVVGADAEPGTGLDPDRVAALDQLLDALGRQPDAVFLVLDLARAADQHGLSPPVRVVTPATIAAQSERAERVAAEGRPGAGSA